MKRIVMTALLIVGLGAVETRAGRSGDQGIGVMVGNPTGFSWKMWFDDVVALDGALGVAQSEFDIHLTLLFHNFDAARRMGLNNILAKGELPFYIGVGPRILFEDDEEVGIRLPLGVSFLPRNSTWETFFEVAPVVRLTPDTGVDGDFAIGVRYYFPTVRPLTQP